MAQHEQEMDLARAVCGARTPVLPPASVCWAGDRRAPGVQRGRETNGRTGRREAQRHGGGAGRSKTEGQCSFTRPVATGERGAEVEPRGLCVC